MFLHIHEYQGGKFKPADNNFHSSSSIPSTTPWVFDIGDFIGIDTEGLGQHGMALLNTFFHPVDDLTIVWTIEYVVSHHFEGRKVTARAPNGINIGEAYARLRDGQWVCRRVYHSRSHMRLEVGN